MSAKLYRPLELLRRIQSEHQDDYVYRGESRTFSAPLWPSKYRAVFRSEAGLKLDPQLTVRGCGRQFFFMSKFVRNEFGNKDTHRYEQYVNHQKLRLECMSKIRNALGYVLSEAMFQQAGWSSEGVDVSRDPRVAMTFALAKWDDGHPRPVTRPDPAVLLRFRVKNHKWTLDELRRYNYFSSPSFIPTLEICRLFRKGTRGEFYASLKIYQQAIRWNCLEFELDGLQGARPFEIICLPTEWAENSRVERQQAALLLPDAVRPEATTEIASSSALGMMKDVIGPDGKQVPVANYLRYGTFHEDIYSRADTDKFLVDVSEDVYINEIASFLDMELLPKSDDTFDLLANWIQPHFEPVTRYGTLPMELGGGKSQWIDAQQWWDALMQLEPPERQFSR